MKSEKISKRRWQDGSKPVLILAGIFPLMKEWKQLNQFKFQQKITSGMPRIPIVNSEKLIRLLKKKGFVLNRISGSHHILIHKDQHLRVSVPVHKGKTLGRGITLAILKDAGVNPSELNHV